MQEAGKKKNPRRERTCGTQRLLYPIVIGNNTLLTRRAARPAYGRHQQTRQYELKWRACGYALTTERIMNGRLMNHVKVCPATDFFTVFTRREKRERERGSCEEQDEMI